MSTYSFRIGSGGSALSWRWLIAFLISAGALPIVWYVPSFERVKFRVEKSLFLLRRRYGRRNYHSSSGASPSANDYSGETLSGRYFLSRIVSRGGFSVVYEARHVHDGDARLAVKVLNRGAGQEGWIRDRFAHEVAALRSIEHPGVVRILDSWISPAGEPCLAMPFLEGETLRAALSQGPFGVQRVARIVRSMGAALAEVHNRGVVHRDLKPENVILMWPKTDREQPVILDFGTAGLRSADNELAATTLMAGSFHYMAPERLSGRYAPTSDVFSFAVMILEMLAGRRLADFKSMFSEPSFRSELEDILRTITGPESASAVAGHLAAAFCLEPRRRPAAVKEWADEMAASLD